MSKRLILVLALAFVVSIAVCAYAEVQNVKVSGDLLMRAISRTNFTLLKTDDKYKVGGLTSTARLRVDADLTDNVIATVRLLNERSWGANSLGIPTVYGKIIGGIVDSVGDSVTIDLAYVTLKEFLYSPLTLTVGRQELRFGNALIIGDVDSNLLASEWQIPWDLSSRKAFDAIRANLNYDPLVVDFIYAKVDEVIPAWWLATGLSERDDTDLYGVNAAYNLKDLGITGNAQLYYFGRVNRLPVYSSTSLTKQDICNTVGMLVSGKVVDNLTGSMEYAYQFGNAAYDTLGVNSGVNLDRRAWALQGMLNYAFQTKYNPSLAVAYTYLSGDKTDDGVDNNWDPMFEDQMPNSIVNALFPQSNVQALHVVGNIKPTEDLTLSAKYGYYMLAQKLNGTSIPGVYDSSYSTTDKKDVGNALDLTATYDYTEDVQLGLTFGYFNPGSAFDKSDGYKQNATQLIGSMKVTF